MVESVGQGDIGENSFAPVHRSHFLFEWCDDLILINGNCYFFGPPKVPYTVERPESTAIVMLLFGRDNKVLYPFIDLDSICM